MMNGVDVVCPDEKGKFGEVNLQFQIGGKALS